MQCGVVLLSLAAILNPLQHDFSMGKPSARSCAQFKIKCRRRSSFLVVLRTNCSTQSFVVFKRVISVSQWSMAVVHSWVAEISYLLLPLLNLQFLSSHTKFLNHCCHPVWGVGCAIQAAYAAIRNLHLRGVHRTFFVTLNIVCHIQVTLPRLHLTTFFP